MRIVQLVCLAFVPLMLMGLGLFGSFHLAKIPPLEAPQIQGYLQKLSQTESDDSCINWVKALRINEKLIRALQDGNVALFAVAKSYNGLFYSAALISVFINLALWHTIARKRHDGSPQ